MAVTKIWAIKDSLLRVVDYASNPQKTTLSDLKQVLVYAENENKTIDKDEETIFVTGINCDRKTAYEEMHSIQKQYDKCTGNVAYHAYQSFKRGEVSPELAHKIGVQLAKEMWEGHQVLVATHLNTGTYHNHFVVNSVNMFTGKKFNCNKKAYYHFRQLSDELCAENNLTVIKNPKGKTPRSIFFAEKRGEPTKYNLMRQAINESMEISISYAQFKKVMYKKGYIINDDYNRKYPTIRSIHDKKATRMYQLGEEYLPKNIANKVEQNPYYYQNRYYDYIKPKRKCKKFKVYRLKGSYKSISRKSTIEILFITLFYFLGIYPKDKSYHKPLSPEMKQEVRKMEQYSSQIKLIVKEKLETIEDVKQFIARTEKDITDVTNIRQKYRNKLRNCTDDKLILDYKNKRDECTSILKDYRKKIKIANQIIENTPKIKEIIKIEKQMINEQREIEKNKNRNRGVR